MPLDEALLERHRSFEHDVEGARVRETFLSPVLGGARTTAALYEPVEAPTTSTGWVICHSFGIEQTFLGEHEVAAARALAASGFAVLRYHGSGYGDSEGDPKAISLGSHLRDAADAVELLRERGAERIGVAGGRFGGTVAALTADRLALPLLAAWEPVVKGSQFVRELLRSRDLFDMFRASGEGEGHADAPMQADPLEELRSRGWSDVKGIHLTTSAHDEIAAVDLTKDVSTFRGHALVVGVARTERPSAPVTRFAERLREIGANVDLEVVIDEEAPDFGLYHYDNEDDPNAKHDLQVGLQRSLARTMAAWATRVADVEAGVR